MLKLPAVTILSNGSNVTVFTFMCEKPTDRLSAIHYIFVDPLHEQSTNHISLIKQPYACM